MIPFNNFSLNMLFMIMNNSIKYNIIIVLNIKKDVLQRINISRQNVWFF